MNSLCSAKDVGEGIEPAFRDGPRLWGDRHIDEPIQDSLNVVVVHMTRDKQFRSENSPILETPQFPKLEETRLKRVLENARWPAADYDEARPLVIAEMK